MWDVDFRTAVAQAEVEDRPQRGRVPPHPLRGRRGRRVRHRHHAPRAAAGLCRRGRASRRRAVQAPVRPPRGHPSLPRAGADLPEPAGGPREGNRHPHGLHVRRRRPTSSGGASRACRCARSWAATGRLLPVSFGGESFPSLDPAAANARLRARRRARRSRKRRRRSWSCCAIPRGPPARTARRRSSREPQPIEHPVKFFEKGDRPLEFITTRQWFVRLLEHKDGAAGRRATRSQWHPDFMRLRYRTGRRTCSSTGASAASATSACRSRSGTRWTRTGRTRLRASDRGRRGRAARRPDDGLPPGYEPGQRDQPGGFRAETDVFDTWFTSSLSPQIASGWTLAPERHKRLFPMDLRPQSHEIIRTWAFYTIAKALLHEDDDPLAPRRHLGLGARPRPQEDVEEQGQRHHAHAPSGPVRVRRRALLVALGAPGDGHRLRREGAEGGPPPRDQALQRLEVRPVADRSGGADQPRAGPAPS